MNEIPFYDDRYVYVTEPAGDVKVDIHNPVEIYNHLLTKVYKQDRYCRDAAMILYDHICGITSRNIVCGPAGCGKTYVWNCLKELFPRILIVDASNITKDGWSGGHKVTDFLDEVDVNDSDYIVVFDEFDKCATPQYSRGMENVSAQVQSEFLKLIEGKNEKRKKGTAEINIDTSGMSFVFCGSFAQKAGEIAEKQNSFGLGFGNEKKEGIAFEKELTINDLIDFGVIPELASRCTRLVNVRPLSVDDYAYLVTEHSGSPIKSLEKKYGMPIRISRKKKMEIARTAFESGLGIRNVSAQIQRIMDDRIFERFLNKEERPETRR
ncbi:MAG: AAA family ATPase [Lachnospiraceae bacterium]|nr:AAA family ATPase [Lachnospiraceae bacterium]